MDRRLTFARTAPARVLPLDLLRHQSVVQAAAAAALLLVVATPAWAAGAAMPWDNTLGFVLDNLSGRTARVAVLLAMVGCGVTWMFTRHEEGFKWLSRVALGGAIATSVVSLFTAFGFVAGAEM